jgi:hypothetical protein
MPLLLLLSSFSRCLVTPLSLFSSVAWRITRRARSQPRSLKSPQSMEYETGLEPMDVEVTDLDSMDVGVAKIDTFGALRHVLNPYLDELLRSTEFYRFMDLPLELRLMVHSHYCNNDTMFLIRRDWVSTECQKPYVRTCRNNLRRRASAPFLPSLCLVSQALRAEVVHFILQVPLYAILSRKRAVSSPSRWTLALLYKLGRMCEGSSFSTFQTQPLSIW